MNKNPHQAFLEKYQLIHEAFTRYCSSRSYGLMETGDLVQEAVFAGLKNFKKIKDHDKLLSYLIGVVNNIIRNKKRQAKFRGSWEEHLLEKLESKTPSPEVALDIHFLLRAMSQLPKQQEEALILFEISGFSIREISEIQDSSEAATKTRLSRARQTLRKRFEEKPKAKSLSSTLAAYASILL